MTGITPNKVIQSPWFIIFDSQRINSLLNAENQVTSLFSLNENWLKKGSDDATIPVEVRSTTLSYEKDISNIWLLKDITSKKENWSQNYACSYLQWRRMNAKELPRICMNECGPYLSAANCTLAHLVIDDNDRKGHEIKKELNELLNLSHKFHPRNCRQSGIPCSAIIGTLCSINDFISKINYQQ